MLGGDLIVAPVVEDGARQRTLQLPHGGWYSLSEDAYLDGSQQVTLEAPLEHIPVLVRAGAVLPMEEGGRLELHLYRPPDGEPGSGQIYNDAGDGYGPWRLDRFRLTDFDGGFKLKKTSEGAFSERYGRIELYLHGFSAARVVVDAREMEHENGRVQIRKFSTVRFLI